MTTEDDVTAIVSLGVMHDMMLLYYYYFNKNNALRHML